jgi:hypothetical protein
MFTSLGPYFLIFSMINLVSHNVLSADLPRQEILLEEWHQRGFDVGVMQGTRRRHNDVDLQPMFRNSEHFLVIEFGWRDKHDAHSGILIAFANKLLKKGRITEVFSPPANETCLWGRVGGVRFKSAHTDFFVFGFYPPPSLVLGTVVSMTVV